MGLEGIKLIACDLDGTLLHPGEREPRSEAFELIDELHRRGIVFMPASGRQYASLRYLFAPVADELAYVCENGALPWSSVLWSVAWPWISRMPWLRTPMPT
jgi:HAD superfamily hydrolase (TIGR01484 family)